MEEKIVRFSDNQEAVMTMSPCHDVESSPKSLMPRGMEQDARAPQQCLRVVETAFLCSGSGSRSDAIVEGQTMVDLVASISSVGIIEPIVVRQVATNEFVIVAGERRFAAAKVLKLHQIPCVVTQCSDSEALVISLTENLQRSDLDPVDKARALRRLRDEFALTQQEIGRRVGMSQSAIAHHLRLLSLPHEVQRLISKGDLSVGHGKVLASIADNHEAINVAMDCISKNQSVREFEAAVSIARGKSDKRPPRGSVRNKREEHELGNGLFLVIKESHEERGRGTIEIPFYSVDERNWVLKALSQQEVRRRKIRDSVAAAPATPRHQGRSMTYPPAHGPGPS